MARRGRKPNLEKTIPWHIEVPEDLALKVDLLITNPLTGKVKYGERKKLVIQLLRGWLDEQINTNTSSPKDPKQTLDGGQVDG